MENPMTNWKLDDRPKRKAWAPGKYLFSCNFCGCSVMGDKRALSCADCAYLDWKPTHRHGKTGGLYKLLDQKVMLEATNELAVLYEAQDGTVWARAASQFFDGRFATIDK